MPIVTKVTDPALAPEVAAVAAATFPLACPPHASPESVAAFIAANLGPTHFADHIASTESEVLVVRESDDGPVIGYSLIHHRPPNDPAVAAIVTAGPASEISKIYVLPDHHAHRTAVSTTDDPSAGNAHQSPAQALIGAAVDHARARGAVIVWLGVNQLNERAQRFYAKSGFTRAGTKTFDLGGRTEHDYVLVKRLARGD